MAKFKLYEAIRNHDFSETTCFLCGTKIEDTENSREHVFPKWLLHHFGLWDIKVELLNATLIPYRDLVIPCCVTCNNDHLSRIELEVLKHFQGGPEMMAKMNRDILFLWTLKIFYGLLYRELSLLVDRGSPEAGSIVSPEDMEQYQLLHFILQSCRIPMQFTQHESDIPGSLFVFKVQEPANPRLRFDYKDDVLHRTLYLRLGSVGILVAFDMGAQTHEGAHFFPKTKIIPCTPYNSKSLVRNCF